jgi:hypothetical protein
MHSPRCDLSYLCDLIHIQRRMAMGHTRRTSKVVDQ